MPELLLFIEEQLLRLRFSWLLLLPAIAGILIFQGTWLDNGLHAKGRTKKYRRRLRTTILIHRALIINLLLATFIVSRSSLTALPLLLQGLLLAVILMLPVLVYLLIVVYKWPAKKTVPAVGTFKKQQLVDSTRQATDAAQVSQLNVGTATLEQNKLASSLHNNIKLQKLVTVQKTVIEIEKQRYQKALAMTQNAMTALHKTREGTRVAIRVAQRERRERLRLEADNAIVRRQLKNMDN